MSGREADSNGARTWVWQREDPRRRGRRTGGELRRTRRLTLIASFLLCFVAASLAIRASLDLLGAEYRHTWFGDIKRVQGRLGRLESAQRGAEWVHVVYQANSTGERVARLLQHSLSRLAPEDRRFELHNLVIMGQSPLEYYFLSEPVIRARPDSVLMGVNLSSFSADRPMRAAHEEFVGWVPPSQLPEACSLSLEWSGLTLDRVLAYMALVQAGLQEPWLELKREQVRLDTWYRRSEIDADAWAGLEGDTSIRGPYVTSRRQRNVISEGRNRASPEAIRNRYGPALRGVDPEHPVLRALEAVLRRYREAEIPTLVYVVPVNVEHIRQLVVYDEAGLRHSLDLIEDRVRSAGATFADLHDAFPDSAFRDFADHLGFEGEDSGVKQMADRLALLVLRQAHPRGEVGD